MSARLVAALSLCAVLCPGIAMAWAPGVYPPGSRGFSVDSSDRNDVLSFWHGVYRASEGYHQRINWSGSFTSSSTAAGAEGTISPAFVVDIERRMNFHRALVGVPADVRVNSGATLLVQPGDPYTGPALEATPKSAAVQRSAFMIMRTYKDNNSTAAMSHNPPTNCVGWTQAAWHGNARGNLAFNFYGPGAIDEYMREDAPVTPGDKNRRTGHRRWVLALRSTDFATGDTPGSLIGTDIIPATNVLYVIPKPSELQTGLASRFVSYPTAGFFPAPLNSKFWSLSYFGANFSNATVSMQTSAGANVPLTVRGRDASYGDPAISWEVGGAAAAKSVMADTTYHVTVSGITGTGVPSSYSYSVTLIDPNKLTTNQTLTGTDNPPVSRPAAYLIPRQPRAEALEVGVFQRSTTAWTETAENTGTAKIIDGTAASYELFNPSTFSSYPFGPINGSRSFRLTLPNTYDAETGKVPEQFLAIDRELLPGAGASLTFKYRRGLSIGTSLAVETSTDEGGSWTQLGAAIPGRGDSNVDPGVTTVGYPLPSGLPLRVRFRLFHTGGSFYTNAGFETWPTGFFLDDVTVNTGNCPTIELKKSNALGLADDRFWFDASATGQALANGQEWLLRLRVKLGNRWFPYGPIKTVTVTSNELSGYDAWEEYDWPEITGGFSGDWNGDGVANGIEYAFPVGPPQATQQVQTKDAVEPDPEIDSLILRRPLMMVRDDVIYSAEWSDDLQTWSTEGVSIFFTNGEAVAVAPLGEGRRFIRWNVAKD